MEEQNSVIEKSKEEQYVCQPEKTSHSLHHQGKTISQTLKQNKKLLLIGFGGFIILMVLIFCFLYIYPKYVLSKSLNIWKDSFEVFSKPMRSIETYSWEDMTTKGTIDFKVGELLTSGILDTTENEDTMNIFKKVNNLSFEVDARVSQTKEKSFFNLLGNFEKNVILDIALIKDNQKQYILLKDIFEKYLELEEPQEQVYEHQISYDDIDYVWEVFKKSFKKNIKSSYIKKQNEKIIVDGKTVNTTKFSLIIDEKVDAEFTNNMIKDLKADEKAFHIITEFYPEFAIMEEIKPDSAYTISYSVNVTKGSHKIVKVSVSTDDNNIFSLIKGKEDILEFVDGGKTIMSITTKEEKDGFQTTFLLQENNVEFILTGTKDDEHIVYNLSIEQNGVMVDATLLLTLQKLTEEAYQEQAILTINIKTQGITVEIATLTFDFETVKGAEFEEIKDSIPITDLTEKEQEKIITYFENITKLLN